MPDIFDVLIKDHTEVKQMLAKLEKQAPGNGKREDRKKQASKLIGEESRHEVAEETAWWPAVRDKLPDGDKLAGTATSQEQEAKEVLAKLDKLEAGTPEFEKLLTEFTKAAREHIEFEESQVWPPMREALSGQEASEMARKFQEAKKGASAKPQPGQAPGRRAARGGGKRSDVPAQRTRAELYEQARKLGVQGRSTMTKDELAREVARQG